MAALSALSIREVSARSGCPASALRYYEEVGLISALPRSTTAGRTYDPRVLDTLYVISALRGVGFGVREVADFLSVKRPGEAAAQRLERARGALEHLQAGLARKRAALEQAEALLAAWQAEVEGAPPNAACRPSEAE